MKNESTADSIVDALTQIARARESVDKFNDFGSPYGFRDEIDQLDQELKQHADRIALRASRLCCRVRKYNEGEREAPTIESIRKPTISA